MERPTLPQILDMQHPIQEIQDQPMEPHLPEVHHQVIIGMLVLLTTEAPAQQIERLHLQEVEILLRQEIPHHLTAPQVEVQVVV